MKEQPLVLVVEDDESIRALVDYNLKLDGFNVLTAESAEAGLELAGEWHPNLILLDIMMLGMDGLEALTELKNNEQLADIPVIMLTAKGMLADIERAYALGADGYITKPFDPVQLGQRLKRTLETQTPALV
jgi:CheY-like chemotaxis protein